jgi:hypothetical protein
MGPLLLLPSMRSLPQVTAPGLDMQFLDTELRPLMETTFAGECFL